eukprot:CAMPEP_0184487862 /NCGR_PEP_ID=MMETSP0113_2-20130426/10375_1 /TAXON_ID=91329 /ORGANISM="Norrisiella sphaerica, Strain BC52" /LENGTH=429 /DNA_ID=CAMNT_0026870279 /DNA_START=17 /DNA_END=1306 /DNA_ORIENTATION=-
MAVFSLLAAAAALLSNPVAASWHAVEHGSVLGLDSQLALDTDTCGKCPFDGQEVIEFPAEVKGVETCGHLTHGKSLSMMQITEKEPELLKKFPDLANETLAQTETDTYYCNCPSDRLGLALEQEKNSETNAGCYWGYMYASIKFCKPVTVKEITITAATKWTKVCTMDKHGCWTCQSFGDDICGNDLKTFHLNKEGVVKIFVKTYSRTCARIKSVKIEKEPCPCPNCEKIGYNTHISYSDADSIANFGANSIPTLSSGPITLSGTDVKISGKRNGQAESNSFNYAFVTDVSEGLPKDEDLSNYQGEYILTLRDSSDSSRSPNEQTDKPNSVDWRFGGTLTFEFPCEVSIDQITLIDIDSKEDGGRDEFAKITFNFSGDVEPLESHIPGFGDSEVETFNFEVSGVTSMEIYLSSSGAIGDFKIDCVCPGS